MTGRLPGEGGRGWRARPAGGGPEALAQTIQMCRVPFLPSVCQNLLVVRTEPGPCPKDAGSRCQLAGGTPSASVLPFLILHPTRSRRGVEGQESPQSPAPGRPSPGRQHPRRPQQSRRDLCATLCALPRCCIECTYVGTCSLLCVATAAAAAHASAPAPGARGPFPRGPRPRQPLPCPPLCPCFIGLRQPQTRHLATSCT